MIEPERVLTSAELEPANLLKDSVALGVDPVEEHLENSGPAISHFQDGALSDVDSVPTAPEVQPLNVTIGKPQGFLMGMIRLCMRSLLLEREKPSHDPSPWSSHWKEDRFATPRPKMVAAKRLSTHHDVNPEFIGMKNELSLYNQSVAGGEESDSRQAADEKSSPAHTFSASV